MSKQFVDKLLKELLSKVNGGEFRKKVDALPQIVTVTKDNLAEGIKEGYYKSLGDSAFHLDDEDFQKAAGMGMRALVAHLAKERTLSRLKTNKDEETKIVFSQPRGVTSPFTAMKKGAITELSNILKIKGIGKLSKEESTSIMSGVERLHQGKTTVGAAQLTGVVKMLNASKSMRIKDFIVSEQAKELTDLYKEIEGTYKVVRSKNGYTVKEAQEVAILVDASSKNYAGSEDYDWAKIKPILEKSLKSWADKQDWPNHKGSKTPTEKLVDDVEYTVLSQLQKVKGVKVRKKVKKPNSKARKSQATKIAGTTLATKNVRKRKSSAKITRHKTQNTSFSQVKLYAALNAKINTVVAKNMELPGLQYQTGRFASGVKITDVSKTPQGFPSIGYTYQLYPYQTFEPGFKQGSIDRDPRKLIDRSIREIAAQMVTGRLYTRRQ
jgi:hypothetical protein